MTEDELNYRDTLRLVTEVRLQRHRADENQRRVEALERQALADAEVTRGLRELVECATRFDLGEVKVIRIAGPASMWWVCPRDKDTERADTRDEAIARARTLTETLRANKWFRAPNGNYFCKGGCSVVARKALEGMSR